MFGKFFASAFTGSLRGKGPEYFAVLGYIVAHTGKDHLVELNTGDVADRIGMEPDMVEKVIAYFCKEDKASRGPEQNGRRLVQQGKYQYFVVNHEHYRSIRDMDDFREYNREAKRRQRAKEKECRGPTAGEIRYVRTAKTKGIPAADALQDAEQAEAEVAQPQTQQP